MSFEGQICRTWANELKFKDSEKIWTLGIELPPPRAIYMYINTIFKDHFLQNPWPIKVKFYRRHLYEGGTNVFLKSLGYITKMAAMPIMVKTFRHFFSGTVEPIARKLYM